MGAGIGSLGDRARSWLRGNRRRAVAGAGAVVVVAGVLAGTVAASASGPPLPSLTPRQLLAKGLAAKPPGPLTAVVQETANLGFPALPDIPGMSSSSAFSAASLIAGTHEIDIWYGGPKRIRIALPVKFGETDLRVNGDQVWLWQSSNETATKITLPAVTPKAPASPGATPSPSASGPLAGLTPSAAASKILSLVGPSTTVRSLPSTIVAGHDAYQLAIVPTSGQSLIGQVQIAFDAQTMLPLQVVVTPRGSSVTAFEMTYSALSYGAPDPSNFTFTPPPGATVKNVTMSGAGALGALGPAGSTAGAQVRVSVVKGIVAGKLLPKMALLPAFTHRPKVGPGWVGYSPAMPISKQQLTQLAAQLGLHLTAAQESQILASKNPVLALIRLR